MTNLAFIALYQDQKTLAFWQELAPYFEQTFRLTFLDIAELEKTDLSPYQGLLTCQPVTCLLPTLLVNPDLSPWQISQDLHQFAQSCQQNFLDYLPWRVTFFAPDGQVLYSNQRADGSFFFLDEEVEPLEDWILAEIKASPTGAFHLPISLESFDQKLVQSFHALYDDEKNFLGILQYTQEISQLLASYLEDSGQALVGWSDVTSGASISNQD